MLVIGAGPIGLGTMQFAGAKGARVTAIYGLWAKRGHRAWGIAQDIAQWKVQEDQKGCGLKGHRAKGIAHSV